MPICAARFRVTLGACVWLCLAAVSHAQTSPVIQFFVPGQGLPTREVRFSLTLNGLTQVLKSDAKGMFQFPSPLGSGTFAIYVEGDKRSYAITSFILKLAPSQTHQPIFLRPLPETSPYSGPRITEDAPAPAEAVAAYETAVKAAVESNPALAISQLTRALTLHPTYLRALTLLGEIYIKLELLEQATSAFQQALSFNPTSSSPRLRLAMLWQQQGRQDKALQLFYEILQEQPQLTNVRLNYAEALSAANQWDEAETQLREVLKDQQLDAAARANAHLKLGIKLNRDGRPQAVATEFTKAVEADPNSPQARLYLGAALIQINKLPEAERELLKAYELGGKTVSNAQLLLGQVYRKLQKLELARRAYEQFLSEAPNSSNAAVAREALEKIKAGIKVNK